MSRHIVAITMEFETIPTSQASDELLIRVRFPSPQFVIEMNDREHNPQLAPQLEQQTQQRNRINPAGNGHTNTVSGPQHLLPPDMGKHALCQGVHANMVSQGKARESG
ncbi:MAG TPA: hypothetical protein VEH47_02765 [Candidatus Acidoferrales bacterium]|nr:hypothetical protein [Candidatus Acidoferrales bacterium]